MKIGIIGAGNIGGTLTRRLTELGHKVSVANSRGPETLGELAAETGAKAVTVEEAARDKDVVVVTIPERNIPSLPSGLFAGGPDDVVVVDTGNYYPQHRDGRIAAVEDGLPESRWVEQQLGQFYENRVKKVEKDLEDGDQHLQGINQPIQVKMAFNARSLAEQILSPPEAHEAVLQALEKASIPTESAEIAMVPKNTIRLEGKNAQAMLRLYDVLEEHDDVQNVYGNYEVDEAEVEALA